jgi:hypothetical protein
LHGEVDYAHAEECEQGARPEYDQHYQAGCEERKTRREPAQISQSGLVFVEKRWKVLDPTGPKPCQLELDLLPECRDPHQVARLPSQVCERFRCKKGIAKPGVEMLASYRAGGMVDVEKHLIQI